MGDFLRELKRRNVFRVGAAYVVVSWLIIQVIETISDPLALPPWTEAFFIVLVLAGLPIVLMFAWAFELTPEGLKKTGEVAKESSVTADTGRKLNYAIIAVLVVALGYFVWERQGLVARSPGAAAADTASTEITATTTASLAVLPFVNMSADAEQEYFSDGISEELLNLLAKIPGLRVPARTSSFQFKGQNIDIADVAEQLNVAHVLEGSVRKADVRVRVTAQLIEAKSGYHLWSETYDRELNDIFAIQDEISAAIVAELSKTLGLKSGVAPQVNAAANAEAYNAYLLGQHFLQLRTKEDIEAAIPAFERALQLDPEFAPAHAGAGLAWYLLTASRETYGTLTLEQSLAKALPHVEKALALDPMLPEALGIMGLILDARERQEEAVSYYEKALQLNPSLTDVRNWYSLTLQELGRVEESFAEQLKAYELDPLSRLTLNNYVNELVLRRQFDEAEPVVDRLSQLDPARGAGFRAFMLVRQSRQGEGVIQALRGIDGEPANLRLRAQTAFLLLGLGLEEDALHLWPYKDRIWPIIADTADTQYALELAQQAYEEDPHNAGTLESLAWAQWDAGRKAEALESAGRYLGLLGAVRRPIDEINLIIALDAWERGDEALLAAKLRPLEDRVDRDLAAGITYIGVHLDKAMLSSLRGRQDEAYDHLLLAFTSGAPAAAFLDRIYSQLHWNELPEFVLAKQRLREHLNGERQKLLAVACSDDGFTVWRPSPETCGTNNPI